MTINRKNLYVVATGAVVLALAVFFRVWNLNHMPEGLYPDVASNGIEALNIHFPHGFQILYQRGPANADEGMIMWLEWPVALVMGHTAMFIYVTTVIIGLLTLPVHYLFVRRMFGQRVALLSTAFLALSYWDVTFSRLGYRTLLIPLFLDALFLSAMWAFTRGAKWRWAICGAIFGLGIYTYTNYRLLILFVPLLAWLWWRRTHTLPGTRGEKITGLAMAAITGVPMAIATVSTPQLVFGHADGISVFAGPLIELPVRLIAHTFDTLAMFNFSGDVETQYNVPHLPLLDPFVGIGFIIGLVAVWRGRRTNFACTFLLLWLGIFSIAVLLSDRTPHFLRASGVVPPAYIIAAIGVDRVLTRLASRWRMPAATGVVMFAAAWTGLWYFGWYPAHVSNLYREFHGEQVQIAEFMQASDFQGRPLYVMATYKTGTPKAVPDRFRTLPMEFENLNRIAWTFLPFTSLPTLTESRAAIIYDLGDSTGVSAMHQRYPHGVTVYTFNLPDGFHFGVFYTDGPGYIRAAATGPYVTR